MTLRVGGASFPQNGQIKTILFFKNRVTYGFGWCGEGGRGVSNFIREVLMEKGVQSVDPERFVNMPSPKVRKIVVPINLTGFGF